MDMVMEVAHYILIIGGALCVLIFFFILFNILITIRKAKGLVTNVQDTYKQTMFMALAPMNKIKKRLWEEEDEIEEFDVEDGIEKKKRRRKK